MTDDALQTAEPTDSWTLRFGDAELQTGLGLTTAFGAVWLATYDALYRFDPASGTINRTIAIPHLAGVRHFAASEEHLWLARGPWLWRVNPISCSLERKLDLRPAAEREEHELRDTEVEDLLARRAPFGGFFIVGLAVGYGVVWLLSPFGQMLRVDAEDLSLKEVKPYQSSSLDGPRYEPPITAGGSGIWANEGGEQLVCLDPEAFEPRVRAPLAAGRAYAVDVVINGDAVWILADGCLMRVDPASAEVIERRDVARSEVSAVLLLPAGRLLTSPLDRTPSNVLIWKIQSSDGTIVDVLQVHEPTALAADQTGLWALHLRHAHDDAELALYT